MRVLRLLVLPSLALVRLLCAAFDPAHPSRDTRRGGRVLRKGGDPTRPDYPAFADVAQAHPSWPEIRWFCGALPYTAADRTHGITVASDDLELFAAALGADAAEGGPSYARPREPEASCAHQKETKEEKALIWNLMAAVARRQTEHRRSR